MRTLVALVLALLGALPGQKQWHGFDRTDFELDGNRCWIIAPKAPAPDRPWIWRARFFGHEPQTEIALLRAGFHVVYCDVGGLFGNDEALRRWDACYAHVTETHALAPRPALLGMSRGGLVAVRWAARHPRQVACLYLDAPVCDIRSWPGGKGKGRGGGRAWQRCLEVHGLTEADVDAWRGNPIDQLAPLAAARVPILSICGAADRVVPFAENTQILATRYRKLGGPIRVIAKPGVDHHPHSLEDPSSIVAFVLRHTVGSGDYFVQRRGLAHSHAAFAGGAGRVAFLGGSITHNPGWRDIVGRDLQRRFPDSKFEFINAGIPSFGSTPGAFRLQKDVLAKGRIDLLFVEAAVNDSTNGRSGAEMTRGMEGIVRHALRVQPEMDIVMMHFVDPGKMRAIDRGIVPEVIARHEAVATHYDIASIDLATEVTERIAAGEFTWKKDFKNLHPSPFGQRLYGATIRRLFDHAWHAKPTKRERGPLPRPLDPHCYDAGQLVGPDAATARKGFGLVPVWRPKDRAGTRAGFVDMPALVAERPGSSFEFRFRGDAVGILVPAGPDAGRVRYRIDDGPEQEVDLFTKWSRGLHLPWSYVLGSGLTAGEHTLEVRIAPGRNERSRGHAARVVYFLVNAAE